jgi:hypothetical protein
MSGAMPSFFHLIFWQLFIFLSYVMVGRLCETGTLIGLYLCPVARDWLQKGGYILYTTHCIVL